MMSDGPKTHASRQALDYVKDGMVLGLGSGSTAEIFIELLGIRVAAGLKVQGIPTSDQTKEAAREAGIELLTIEHADRIDLTVDGADEIGPNFALIKGGGGRLLREKIIANASDLMVVIADESKLVETLGAYPLPVEVDPFGFSITAKKVFDVLKNKWSAPPEVKLRHEKNSTRPFLTDGGHYILDCACGAIKNPAKTATQLCAVPGVVEHGLFIDLARVVIIGDDNGAQILER
ncbi:MAG: ribose 5-phosphate isomerase A [Robiginitomaculum sp.]|nr:MAG: ribose 5-phosphate isomerase A [Robiginitomaculum sp.]